MVTIVNEESAGGRVVGGLSGGHRCQSSDTLTEWRSSDQVENGIPSTSPPYWDTDDSDDDGGAKPPELYGKYTWKIEKFSQITKRELRSNAFVVGGYKWYILIYPQGCDVCNHLSLFLCVANHDKLLPGWSHFAQFTIAVVNKDPKKSKYSDTLHRFWKKEHDWGWKKFMELSKVSDGFVDADTLIIKAQVQVIREKADRPFRCLDCQYRRELVRVYLTNVEQICRRFVEERRGKLEKLIEDKARWSSFCAFWLGMDQNTRRRMSREKKDTILKVAVKNFFIEKEVTSTLVMDSLYSGLKALEGQSKSKKGKAKLLEGEETPPPIIRIEKDMFVLVDDVLLLLEKAAMEPLPPKDDKGPQNRTKDGGSGDDFNKDSIERDERRLTELGRRTVEIFVLAHIFSNKIEVAYQEAVALRRQEELIREEEAAWLVESEQKARRGVGEKDKKSKKKQAKQKRNNRKGKDKSSDEKPAVTANDKQLHENLPAGGKDLEEPQIMTEKDDVHEEDVSDVSDIAECAVEMLQPDSEDRDGSPVNWDTDTSEVQHPAEASGSEVSSISTVQNGGVEKRSSSVMDDSSSTCSTDSTPSVVMNGSYRSNSFVNYKSQNSPARGKNQRGKSTFEEYCGPNEVDSPQPRHVEARTLNDVSPSRNIVKPNGFEGAITSLQDRIKWPELNAVKKDDEIFLSPRKQNKDNAQTVSKQKNSVAIQSPKSPPKNTTSVTTVQSPKSPPRNTTPVMTVQSPKSPPRNTTSVRKVQSPKNPSQNTTPAMTVQSPKSPSKNTTFITTVQSPRTSPRNTTSASVTTVQPRPDQRIAHPADLVSPRKMSSNGQQREMVTSSVNISKHAENSTMQQSVRLSRPSSAPLIPVTVAATPVISTVQVAAPSASLLSRSVSATGRLGPDPSLATAAAYIPQSYRNAISGNSFPASSGGFSHPPHAANSIVNTSTSFSQYPTYFSPDRAESGSGQPWMDSPRRNDSMSLNHSTYDSPSMLNDISHFDLYRPVTNGSHGLYPSQLSAGTSGRPVQSALADEFPHLDIINDLLDDEQVIGRTHEGMVHPSIGNGQTLFNRHYTYPMDTSLSSDSRFDRSRNYPDDSFQQDFGPASPYDSIMDFIPQGNSIPYMNGGQIDSLVPNQWQMLGTDLSLMGLRSSVGDGYSYNIPDYSIPDYSNIAGGLNGYAMFRPSNGH